MSATTAGAIKAWLETRGLGISVYRDRVPPDAAMPYVTVQEGIAMRLDGLESDNPNLGLTAPGDANSGTVSDTVQVDVWQSWRTSLPNGAIVESPTLTGGVMRALHGAALPTAPMTVYGLLVRNRVRQLEEDTNLVHDAITVDVKRVL